jgi:hypothetical protein
MMDFIISKVAMSICALLVVSILGGMFRPGALLDARNELGSIIDDFCAIVDMVALSRAQTEMYWTVPHTSAGGVIHLELDKAVVKVTSEADKALAQPPSDVRTWSIEGNLLNSTELAELDSGQSSIRARSGQTIELASKTIYCEHEELMLVFARLV